MSEEYTCIECENLYDDTDGDTDERMCNKCLNDERRDLNIKRSSTVHYPDWDKKKKVYIVPPNKRKNVTVQDAINAIKLTPEYKIGKKLLDGEISNKTIDNIINEIKS